MLLLENYKFPAEIASDGNQAYELVKRRYASNHKMYQLIVMDYAMPFCNGCQSTTLIRQFFAENAPADY